MAGLGKFTANSSGRVRVVFMDRTALDMVADFFTKPLRGKLFTRFRDMVMGRIPVAHVDDPSLGSTPAQERVGNGISETDARRPDDGAMETWADVVKRSAKND